MRWDISRDLGLHCLKTGEITYYSPTLAALLHLPAKPEIHLCLGAWSVSNILYPNKVIFRFSSLPRFRSVSIRAETPQNSYQCSGSRLFFSGQESRVILPVRGYGIFLSGQRLQSIFISEDAPVYFYLRKVSKVFLSVHGYTVLFLARHRLRSSLTSEFFFQC